MGNNFFWRCFIVINYIPISDFLQQEINKILTSQYEKGQRNSLIMPLAGEDCSGCQTACTGYCSGTCTGSCQNPCSAPCTGACQSSCEDKCSNYCQTKCQNGGQTVSTYKNTDSFSWSIAPKTGDTIKITATDWNLLNSTIKSAISAGALLSTPGKNVNQGDVITADIYNSMARAVKTTEIVKDSNGNWPIIEADHFNKLINSYNGANINDIKCCELGEVCTEKTSP